MTVSDFFLNFEQLFLCRFFNEEWTEITFRSEWSVAKTTAGGCTNNATCGNNPQLALLVESQGDMEAFMYLQVDSRMGAAS